ncbi:MAG TPA: transketolase [bacterium]|nr:transketolase [bacterium]HPN31272.1 transketolase [bacterium]
MNKEKDFFEYLKKKIVEVKKETLKLHSKAPETRIASSFSDVEIFASLYYGGILKFDPKNAGFSERDRFIISKGHGAISLYPILADLGFFDKSELLNICGESSILGGIPDCNIPGFETVNGSLGHGLGVACGIARALQISKSESKTFALLGDGELFEGSVWEAVMFAGHHKLSNLILIIDLNKKCMLGYCKDIIDLEPLEEKFNSFRWKTVRVDGHNIENLYKSLKDSKNDNDSKPKVIIADTIKGKGIKSLEDDPICHIKSLNGEETERIIKEL